MKFFQKNSVLFGVLFVVTFLFVWITISGFQTGTQQAKPNATQSAGVPTSASPVHSPSNPSFPNHSKFTPTNTSPRVQTTAATTTSSSNASNKIAGLIQKGKTIKQHITQARNQRTNTIPRPIQGMPRASGTSVVNPTQQKAINQLLQTLGDDANLQMDNVSGTLRHLDGNLEKIVETNEQYASAKQRSDFAAMAKLIAGELGIILNLDNPDEDVSPDEIKTDDLGFTHVTLNQTYKDIPVWGAQLKMHFNKKEEPYLMSGIYAPKPWQMPMAQNPITKTQAIQAAQEKFDLSESSSIKTEHAIYWDIDRSMIDCWKVELASLSHHWIVFVSRINGQIVHNYNHICYQATQGSGRDIEGLLREVNSYQSNGTFHLIDTSRPIYNPGSNPPNIRQTEGALIVLDAEQQVIETNPNIEIVQSNDPNSWDPFAVSMQLNFGIVEEYYRTTFGRQSIDDQGSNILGVIHARFRDPSGNTTSDNAFWNFSQQVVVFGDGDQAFSEFPKSLDVTGHELTHGVIDFSAGLIYENQSGALNEHIADFFGAMIDRDEWLLADGVTPGFDGLRDMENPDNPNVLSRQPTHMSEFRFLPNTPQGDFGGVHINSGIPNRMSFLLAEGPQGIGRDQTEELIYRALTVYLTPRAQLIDYRRALESSARDIHGETSQPFAAVQSAFDAVGITDDSIPDDTTSSDGELGAGENLHAFLLARPELGENPNTNDFFYNLFVFNGSQNTLVTNRLLINSRPAFSGDGAWALFVDESNNLILIQSDLTESVIDDDGNIRTVALSKDQRFIAFTTNEFDNLITFIDLETDDPAREVRVAEIEVPRSDGSLAPVDFPDVLTFNFRGDTLVFDARTTIPVADGENIQTWGLYSIRLADLNVQKLVVNKPGEQFGNPMFANTSDNSLLADWILESEQQPGFFFYNIVSIDLRQNNPGPLRENIGNIGHPTWNGDDNAFLYVRFDRTFNQYALFQSQLSEDKLSTITNDRTRFADSAPVSFPIGFRLGEFPPQRGEISAPNELAFSSTQLDTPVQNEFIVTNTGDADVELIGTTVEGEFADAYSSNTRNQFISPGEEVSVEVTFDPLVEGENPATIVILSSDVDRPRLEVNVNGVGVAPAQQPTNTPTPFAPTPTPMPDEPTPTPEDTQKPIPTPRPSNQLTQRYEFDGDGLEASGWGTLPGGFTGAESGTVETIALPAETIPTSNDLRGLKITVAPGQVAFAYALEPFLTNGEAVLIRASIRADSSNAAPALVGVSGNISTGQVDGSLATQQPANALAAQLNNRNMVLIYEPDQNDIVTPAIQVASISDSETVTIWVDNVELQILSADESFSGELFQSNF